MSDDFVIFLESQKDELLAISDKDLLEGVDVAELRAKHFARIDAAKVEAGRRRMATAKLGVAAQGVSHMRVQAEVNVNVARALIAQAMNDPHCTLAARSLNGMSDSDILKFYFQLRQLKGSDNG